MFQRTILFALGHANAHRVLHHLPIDFVRFGVAYRGLVQIVNKVFKAKPVFGYSPLEFVVKRAVRSLVLFNLGVSLVEIFLP